MFSEIAHKIVVSYLGPCLGIFLLQGLSPELMLHSFYMCIYIYIYIYFCSVLKPTVFDLGMSKSRHKSSALADSNVFDHPSFSLMHL